MKIRITVTVQKVIEANDEEGYQTELMQFEGALEQLTDSYTIEEEEDIS